MEVSQKLVRLRTLYDLTQKQLGEIAGVSIAAISAWELGERSPKLDPVRKICKHFDIDLMSFVDDNDYYGQYLTLMPSTRRVPRLGVIACGEPILAEQNIEDFDDVPSWVKCDFTLLCKGDSMTGARIHDGDVVCIRQQETAENGQIAAVIVDGEYDAEATLKRVRYVAGGVSLWPENAAYEPRVYVREDAARVHIIGVATHFISKII